MGIIQAPRNTIGGTTAGERNIISGNALGVGIAAGDQKGNLLQGNFIGTDVSKNPVVSRLERVATNKEPSLRV